MTNREFYTNIKNGILTDAEKEFAAAAIEKLDATNAKRKEKASEGQTKKAQENAPVVEAILAVLTNDPQSASDIAAQVGVSHNKVTGLIRPLVAAGQVSVTDIKVPKKGTQKGYFLPVAEAEADAE